MLLTRKCLTSRNHFINFNMLMDWFLICSTILPDINFTIIGFSLLRFFPSLPPSLALALLLTFSRGLLLQNFSDIMDRGSARNEFSLLLSVLSVICAILKFWTHSRAKCFLDYVSSSNCKLLSFMSSSKCPMEYIDFREELLIYF